MRRPSGGWRLERPPESTETGNDRKSALPLRPRPRQPQEARGRRRHSGRQDRGHRRPLADQTHPLSLEAAEPHQIE